MPSMMRAIVSPSYGTPDVLELRTIEVPAVGDGGVLVRVRAASLNPLDVHLLAGKPIVARLALGVSRPARLVPGVDVAGVVEAIGSGVTRFCPGDVVFGVVRGGLAEFALARENAIATKPDAMTFEQAAATPIAGLTALQALRDHGGVRPGHRVLINGAGGGVGTFAVQIAKALGAETTAVCGPSNVELIRSLGADRVVDYTREDFARHDRRFHVLLDNVGNRSLEDCRRVLVERGILVMVSGPKTRLPLDLVLRVIAAAIVFPASGRRASPMIARSTPADLVTLGELALSGKVVPSIDRTFPLSETREAFRHLERGHLRGKVVITVP